jgi:phosphonate transport system substrate-binding protein
MEYHFKMNIHATKALIILSMFLITISSTSCISETKPVLKIGGIPDQDTSRIARRYDGFSKYLSDQLNVNVQYVPSINYAAVVTAFTRDELQLAFFGGLTGVQARLQTPGATVIAQREHDAAFHSKFIANPDSELTSLADVKKRSQDLTITFGSESSTSGHLMPRHFLGQAGINADYDFKSQPNFSGSHDLTWKLVESGAFDIGALNEDVWNRARESGKADISKVETFYTTPAFHDYNWTVRPALDLVYGHGFTNKLKNALLELNMDEHSKILDLFSTEKFVTSDNANYDDIEDISRTLGIVK